ncbi:MAG TPA: ABC transporter permease [Aggregatilineales bacterium]|nr:ABC transporter permease [Aggregatilineales bacterium]
MAWTMRTIRGRYQQSILGGLWAIAQPAATAIIFSIIFTYFVPVNTGGVPYVVFSFVAMVPWTLHASSIADMVESIVGNMNLVTKIYFPREVLPVSALFARAFDFLVAFAIIVPLIAYYRMHIAISGWLILPAVLLTQMALALGVGLIGAALNVFYRDIRPIFTLGLQLWFYASPVIYPVSSVPDRLRPFYLLNPMVGVVEAYRAVLLYQSVPSPDIFYSAGAAIVILVFGYWFFKRVEFQFADIV